MFKRRRFPVEIILVCVRWYSTYGISYRDLAEMMQSVLMGLSIKGLYKNLAGHVSHAGVQNDAAHSGKLAKNMECFGSTVVCHDVEFGSLDNELASGDASGEFTIYHEKTWPGHDESMVPAPRDCTGFLPRAVIKGRWKAQLNYDKPMLSSSGIVTRNV